MGDLIDRGEEDLECLNLAFDMFEQAKDSKNDVVLLLGNHELLNLELHFHYVAKNFGGFLSKELRRKAFEGPFGKFIKDNFKAMFVSEGVAFVHAGFENGPALVSPDQLNSRLQQALNDKDYRNPIFRSNGPFWSRKMVYDGYSGKCEETEKLLNFYGVERVVVGHTPQRQGRIGVLCGGKILAIDVGLSRWMYNNFAALEVLVDTVQLPDGRLEERTQLSEISKGGSRTVIEERRKFLNADADNDDL
ncbi:serine/threonine protein phosphatase [Angomonas deanei]|uniref:Calcineurin-like phosphoesterase, putative n=1 Tax=Angomonas deanei TaxID=59799 RepID=A0A7G2CNN0_9TRYP|nr:serine/threonine protein phosphatase [Angomonas deanei]CAD2220551.1 Calcineurin-like phosphoesterase, putative [Angomonas deanei]|eukprot:EPY42174.1 serine/threonine protein phosphatase [Angomonas deanei]